MRDRPDYTMHVKLEPDGLQEYSANSALLDAGSKKIPKVPIKDAIITFQWSSFPRVFFSKQIKYLIAVIQVVRKRADYSVFLIMCFIVSTGLYTHAFT